MNITDQIFKKHPSFYFFCKSLIILIRELTFLNDYRVFKSNDTQKRIDLKWSNRYLCLEDKTSTTNFDRHYIYHTAWAARILARTNPNLHIDISSFLYFSTIVSAFIPTEFYDYRPAPVDLVGLKVGHTDLTKLHFEDNSISSLSCMHVLEHIGLGRYGDTICPQADLLAINELKRVLAMNGQLLIVVPLGQPKIMFNAHRIYSYDMIINYFSDLKLEEFSYISENPMGGGLILNPDKKLISKETYGCGCFLFKK